MKVNEETRKAYCLLADVVTDSVALEVKIAEVRGKVIIKDLEGRKIEIGEDGVVVIKEA